MRKVLKNAMAITLAAAMVVTAAPDLGNSADAAKKLAAAKKTYTVEVKKSVTVKVKNAGKKKTVKWSTTKAGKKVVKIAKAKTKANKKGVASVKVTGKTAGKSAKITAKVGKKSCKFTVKVTAAKADTATQAPSNSAAPSNAAATQAPATSPSAAPTKQGGNNATEAPKATNTPGPTKTPSPTPTAKPPADYTKNASADARKLASGSVITVDGKIGATEWEDADKVTNLLENEKSIRGNVSIKTATAKLMWADDALYALIETDAAMDKVTVYAKAGTADTATAEGTLSSDKKVAEVKVPCTITEEGGLKGEIQINAGGTINYFDSVTLKKEFDAATNTWKTEDVTEIKAGKDDSVLGTINLFQAQLPPTTAYRVENGADIIKAAAIPETFDEQASETIKSKTMTFVNTKFWTDVYTDNGVAPIAFKVVNPAPYDPNNADETTKHAKAYLASNESGSWECIPDRAKGYLIWDDDYLYVLYDIADEDIAPADESNPWMSDSVEFFFDEDGTCTAYTADGDAIQVRVNAVDGLLTSNETGTGNYEFVAHAVNKADGRYQVELVIKLHDKHKAGQVMGMELQINDCYTVAAPEPEEGQEKGNDTPQRAISITAYDDTNDAWQNPGVFGRIKLFDKNAAPAEPTEAPVKTAEPGQQTDDPGQQEELKYEATKIADGQTITVDGVMDLAYGASVALPFTSRIKCDNNGDSNTSATARLVWDKDNIYAFVDVLDEKLDVSGANPWQRDGIDFFFDEDNSKEVRENDWSVNPDKFQYRYTGFAKGVDDKEAEAITSEFAGGSDTAKADYAGIEKAYKLNDKGYTIEFKIPFKTKDKAVGTKVGFDIVLQDCTAGRDAEIYLMKTEKGKAYYNNTVEYPEVELVANKPISLDLNTVKVTDGSTFEIKDGKLVITPKGAYTGGINVPIPAEWADQISKITVKKSSGATQVQLVTDGDKPWSQDDPESGALAKYNNTETFVKSEFRGKPLSIGFNNQDGNRKDKMIIDSIVIE